jgi:hypothetical protein
MAAGLPRPSTEENVSTTLSSGITDVATSMDVADASKLVAPCYLVIDRVDSAGTVKSTSLWEYVKVTNIATNTLTISRAQNGSTGQAHSSGAIVEAVVTSAHFEDWYNTLNPEHTSAGGHVITGTMTIAGMNLASVATIASLGAGIETVATHLNIGGASISGLGLGLFPTWYIPSLPSLPTTSLGRPMAVPRAGTMKFVSVTLSGIVSSATVYFDVNKNFSSIFDAGCRPLIANGTFVSTASIATTNLKAGDVLNVDYDICDLGGNSKDAIITIAAY